VRLGSQRVRGEGLRLGTVRRPPRGVPKSQHASRDEARCHRSVQRELLAEHGAEIA
jgi:uncharacterized protein YeaO (DUF488 family)